MTIEQQLTDTEAMLTAVLTYLESRSASAKGKEIGRLNRLDEVLPKLKCKEAYTSQKMIRQWWDNRKQEISKRKEYEAVLMGVMEKLSNREVEVLGLYKNHLDIKAKESK